MPGLDVNVGTNMKDFAIGAGILIAVVAVVYYGGKIVNAVSAGAAKVEEGADYILGQSDDASLGSDLFGWLGGDKPFTPDVDQQLKTCRALYASGRPITSDTCRSLLAEHGVF